MASKNGNGFDYDGLIAKAGADYDEARQAVRAASSGRIAAAEELERLKAEAVELRSALADFEAGKGDPLTAQEFQDSSYRVQWLTGAIKAQDRIVRNWQTEERAANFELQQVHSKAVNDLNAMLKADAEAMATAARARLDEALGIVRKEAGPAPRSHTEQPAPVPDKF